MVMTHYNYTVEYGEKFNDTEYECILYSQERYQLFVHLAYDDRDWETFPYWYTSIVYIFFRLSRQSVILSVIVFGIIPSFLSFFQCTI